MKIFIIDDENDALELLQDAIVSVNSSAEIYSFDDASDAIRSAEETCPDIVFSDIEMYGMNGIEMAKRLKAISPKINIIFVTGYSSYTRDAIRLHASGYITKPVTAKKVETELNNLLYPLNEYEKGIYAHTFGYFELYNNGTKVKFAREKSKELMALLIDRRGEAITNERIAAYLFAEADYDNKIKNQITTIIADLRKSLKDAGIENAIWREWGHVAVNVDMIGCDAYDYQKGIPYAINLFAGEYLEDYSWAEESKARFYWNK